MVNPLLETRGLGRLPALDPRDQGFRAAAALTVPSTRTSRYWNASGWWGDQGATPQCVAYAWTHLMEDGPVTHSLTPAPLMVPRDFYNECQLHDEWEGTDYAGTSVRAGAKVLHVKRLIKEYRWAMTLDEIVQWLLEKGPVVAGTNWYSSMFDAPGGVSPLTVAGSVVGGHAHKWDGVNTRTRLIRMKNSWGRDWGNDGFAYLRFEDAERLLREWGEVCCAVEATDTDV